MSGARTSPKACLAEDRHDIAVLVAKVLAKGVLTNDSWTDFNIISSACAKSRERKIPAQLRTHDVQYLNSHFAHLTSMLGTAP